MSRGQRFSFLAIAVVIAVVAVIVLADSSEDPSGTTSAATATPTSTATAEPQEGEPTETPTATPTPEPTPKPPPLLTGGKVTKLAAHQGDTVRFRVRSPVAEEVHVHTYDVSKDLEPNKTVTVSFKADITGIFEIEFEHSGEQIAELRVTPE